MKNRILWIILGLISIFIAFGICWDDNESGKKKIHKIGEITLVELHGSEWEMGRDYGQMLKGTLISTLDIIKNYFIQQQQICYNALATHADVFFDRYPYPYQEFIHGMAEGSGINLDDCKILNAMETLPELLAEEPDQAACAFLAIPPSMTERNGTILGRNYDFPAPFDRIAKNLIITVLHAYDAMPSAIISMPGQIYCPSCINANGIFIELNNGMPSGGSTVTIDRESLLIQLLRVSQNSFDLEQVEQQLRAIESDYSLIINVANRQDVRSYEFSSVLGMKPFTPDFTTPFVSTNFYLNPAWKGVPEPTDEDTWLGVTRRNNLLSLVQSNTLHTVETVMNIMDRDIDHGGALWDFTIYQMIFDTSTFRLLLKVNMETQEWTEILLQDFF